MAQRSESKDKLVWSLPSKQAIIKQLYNGTTPYSLLFFTLTWDAPIRFR